ncbi:periplasmic heavy metal sensor [Pseudogemmobacter faecipullorum]|uniref:Periplasmic heavy metal sensor n=1 Tax=Pseudogemmobacter faecipullorum TaxID=2755041 RepID=A0ABS8CKE9_9RHOB|nr:periplasmic heavy metal sensor [Pseudogemmobacter faecipullorum]MCB5409862.1 periplasmic heavy metal sensor [Pseudogemmobacter faecipullorum]
MRESKEMATESAKAPAGRGPGWVRLVLVASLALNLVGAGLLAGAWLGHDPKAGPGRCDLAMGPLTAAMTPKDWRAMRPAFLARHPDLGRGPGALEQEYQPLLAALRRDPVDPAAISAALALLTAHNEQRMGSASEVIGAYLTALPAAERAKYVARLEEVLAKARARQARKHG